MVFSRNKITVRKASELIPYARNNKKHPQDQIDLLAANIKEFGFTTPVLIDKDNVIIAGHGRLKAANKVGLDEIPCILVDDLTPAQIKALRIADNRVAELAETDFDMLKIEYEELKLDGLDEFTGWKDEDFEFGEETPQDVEEDDFEVPDEVETDIKQGDIFQLGRHRLMCGDSTDYAIIKDFLGEFVPDLCYTDPPYGMNAVSKSGVLSEKYKTDILGDSDNTVAVKAFKSATKLFPKMKNCWWGANYYSEALPSSECWFVWDKNNGLSDQADCELAYCDFRSVARMYKQASEKTNRVHPTQKPISLFNAVVGRFDKKMLLKNVLDLFGGSGSTLIACEQLNRNCYMMELDPKYCQVIIDRWEKLTNQKAVKVDQ